MPRDLLAPAPAARSGPRDLLAGKVQAPQPEPTVSRTRAAVEGVAQGATFNLGDEIGAALDLPVSALFGGDLGKQYSANLEKRRADYAKAAEQRPGYTLGGEVAGSVLSAPLVGGAGALAKGATIGTRIAAGAKAGTLAGGLAGAGAGEDLGSRTAGGLAGAGVGAVTGAAMPVAIRGAQAVGRGVGAAKRRVGGTVRGVTDPEAEASRRIGVAMREDATAGQNMLTRGDIATAKAAGTPVLNIDRGGETVRALGRSAANQAPAGRAALEHKIGDRYSSQSGRVVDTVRRIVGGGTTEDNRRALNQAARAANAPAYERAYRAPGAQSVWDEGLEQLATAPEVQNAIAAATITGRNRGALAGAPAMRSPFQRDPATGRLTIATHPDGSRAVPTLEFWDHVKRNLDDVGTREARQMAKVLREHLDELVPEYKAARSQAAAFFGAHDALEAGENFVGARLSNDQVRPVLAKMNTAERRLFAEGFADRLVRQVSEASERQNVINSAFIRSPAAKERIEMALGREQARELEAFLRVESLVDRARTAVTGNSTTARQLTELGLAGGGATAYGTYTGDWKTSGGIIAAALMRRGVQGVDRRVAEHVAKMLASEDPTSVVKGLRMVAKNGRLMDALRYADVPATTAGASGAANAITESQSQR